MNARVMSAEVLPGKLEEFVDFFQGEILAEIQRSSGNAGFLVLADPNTNKILNISLWESTEAMTAAGATFKAHAATFGQWLAHPPTPASYTVRVKV